MNGTISTSGFEKDSEVKHEVFKGKRNTANES